MTIPELYQRKAALFAELASIEREMAAAYLRDAHALSSAMQITTSEAGMVAAYEVAALRKEMLEEFAALKKKSEIATESVVESIMALHAIVELMRQERTV